MIPVRQPSSPAERARRSSAVRSSTLRLPNRCSKSSRFLFFFVSCFCVVFFFFGTGSASF